MAKRPASEAFHVEEVIKKTEGKKHSLDSDEEDSGAEEERNNVLHADDIEGEEDGVAGMEGEVVKTGSLKTPNFEVIHIAHETVVKHLNPTYHQSAKWKNELTKITITPFNMKEELEEGHFDNQGHYHWKKEKEIRDGWLDNIDWVKVKGRPEDKYKVHKDDENKGLGDESSSEDEEPEEKFDLLENYKEIIQHMKPKETIAKSIQRLGASSKISSAERWKRKKAGIVDENSTIVTRVTELANQILTKLGNMDIYQETYEKIGAFIAKRENKKDDADLDMYADDFDQKEKTVLDKHNPEKNESENNEEETQPEMKWEFKWNQNDEAIIGPHTTEQMHKWSTEGYFKTGVWVRKQGEDSQFYTSNRIDFELYM